MNPRGTESVGAIRSHALVTRAAIGAAVLASALTANTGHAAPDAIPRAVVRFEELNLDSDPGAQELFQRLSAAARRVCGVGDARELKLIGIEHKCFRESLSRAVQAVHNERLSALYRAQSGVATG